MADPGMENATLYPMIYTAVVSFRTFKGPYGPRTFNRYKVILLDLPVTLQLYDKLNFDISPRDKVLQLLAISTLQTNLTTLPDQYPVIDLDILVKLVPLPDHGSTSVGFEERPGRFYVR